MDGNGFVLSELPVQYSHRTGLTEFLAAIHSQPTFPHVHLLGLRYFLTSIQRLKNHAKAVSFCDNGLELCPDVLK